MNTSTIKQVNDKLKVLPENLLEEVEKYIDFLSFRYLQEDPDEGCDIPEWHKTIVAERLEEYRKNPQNVKNFDDLLKSKREKYKL